MIRFQVRTHVQTFSWNMGGFLVGTTTGAALGGAVGIGYGWECIEGATLGAFFGGAFGGTVDEMDNILYLHNHIKELNQVRTSKQGKDGKK